MRFTKKPTSKRSDKVIPWKQEGFTHAYPDLPATEIPKGGVSEAVNTLLIGDRAFIRPGYEKLNANTLPLWPDASTGFSSGDHMSKVGDRIFSDLEIGSPSMANTPVGSYIVWSDGSQDLIVKSIGLDEWQVDNSTAQSDLNFNIRAPIYGNFWHEKSKKIIIHLGDLIYYTDWNSADGWTQIYLPSGSTLSESRSKFDSEEDLVYLFNSNGIFLLDFTDTTAVIGMQINMASPPNTITPSTSVYDDSDVISRYLPSSEETIQNKFGRRYLFSLLRLDGSNSSDRGDGTRIIKESGTNTFPASNDYIDWKEAWRHHNFGIGDVLETTYQGGGIRIDVSGSSISDYTKTMGDFVSFSISIGVGLTRDVQVDFTGLNTWEQIAAELQRGMLASFPEYEETSVVYSITQEELYFFNGESAASGVSSPNPSTGPGYDIYTNFWHGNWYAYDSPRWTTLGTETTPALQVPSGQYGYTHFGLYSTVTLGPESRDAAGNNLVNNEYFIWQKDVPIIKPFIGIIHTDENAYFNGPYLSSEDLGTWLHQTSGDPNQLTTTRDEWWAEVYDEGTAVNSNSKETGTTTTTTSFKLIDSAALFISTGVAIGDMVVSVLVVNVEKLFAFVVSIDSETQLTIDTDIFDQNGREYIVGGGPMAIGSEEPMTCTKSGTTVTKVLPASGTYDFVEADIGKFIFWGDGDIHQIISITSVTELEVQESGTKSYTGMAFEPSGRNYNDSQTDTILNSRASSFSVLSRFYTALPNNNIGKIVSGFMVTAAEDAVKGYYSQYSTAYRYLAGHHYEEFQQFVLPDLIKELDEVPNQLMVFCKNSTRRFQTNVVESVTDARVGESIAILSGIGVVDENIGISDRMGVSSYGAGFKMVVTSEPGVRLFDGYRYSPNKLIDEQGRPYYKKDFQVLKERIVSYYEPNLYGIMLWGTNDIFVDIATTGPLLGKANKCYRMAVEAQQGFGWSEINGTDWNFIELNHQPMLVTNDDGDKVTVFFSSKEGILCRLSTRKLPSSTVAAGEEMQFQDNSDVGGANGTEITWNMKLREHVASEEQFKLKLQELYLYLRPYDETNKDGSGYDSYGFLDAQVITIKAFVDGNATQISEVYTVNPKATIIQPYKVENRRIQLDISGTTSELIITGLNARYTELKKRRSPSDTVREVDYQAEFARNVFRISRGADKTLNLYTGLTPINADYDYTHQQGPDGKPRSAFQMVDSSDYFEYLVGAAATHRDILFSVKTAGSAAGYIYEDYDVADGAPIVQVYLNGFDVEISVRGTLEHTITIVTGTWTTFWLDITSGSTIAVNYATSSLTITTASASTAEDVALATTDLYKIGRTLSTNADLFDIMTFRTATGDTLMTTVEFEYYLRDIYSYNGFSLFPPTLVAAD